MKPLLRARLQSRRSRGFTLACDDDATIRVTALQPDLVRVTLLRGGEVRWPSLLAAPVTSPGARQVEVYLPRGPECWRDFWTGEVHAPGRTVVVEAPLERLPLLAPAGAIVATTDAGKDYSRLHDEPSRALLVYPGERSGRSSAVIYEDDGITLNGPLTKVTITLEWTPRVVRVDAAMSGDYALPYRDIRVILPEGDTREVEFTTMAPSALDAVADHLGSAWLTLRK
jgi:alpha-glucosidase (family GH31 glycosyl hydrolase)